MKIEVNIDKRYFVIIVSLISILGIVLITNAYGEENPAYVGHSWDDIGDIPEGFADGTDDVEDADADPLNEIQNLNCIVEKDSRKAPLGSSFIVNCPSGYQRTGCTATCNGHWSRKGVSSRDWDLSVSGNGCSIDRNTQCHGDGTIAISTICCKLD